MMKYAIILATVAVMACAQRPPYAGSSNRHYPQVLPQYLPSSVNEVDATTGIVQRVGVEAAGSASTSNTQTYRPYDPYNDPALLAAIESWPREKQPFWYINRQQIQQQLGGGTTRQGDSTTARPSVSPYTRRQ